MRNIWGFIFILACGFVMTNSTRALSDDAADKRLNEDSTIPRESLAGNLIFCLYSNGQVLEETGLQNYKQRDCRFHLDLPSKVSISRLLADTEKVLKPQLIIQFEDDLHLQILKNAALSEVSFLAFDLKWDRDVSKVIARLCDHSCTPNMKKEIQKSLSSPEIKLSIAGARPLTNAKIKIILENEMRGLNVVLGKIAVPGATKNIYFHGSLGRIIIPPKNSSIQNWDYLRNRPLQLGSDEDAAKLEFYQKRYQKIAAGFPGILLYTDHLRRELGSARTLEDGIEEIKSASNINEVNGLRFTSHGDKLTDDQIQASREELIFKIENEARRANQLFAGARSKTNFLNPVLPNLLELKKQGLKAGQLPLAEQNALTHQLLELDPQAAGALVSKNPGYLGLLCKELNGLFVEQKVRGTAGNILEWVATVALAASGVGLPESVSLGAMKLSQFAKLIPRFSALGFEYWQAFEAAKGIASLEGKGGGKSNRSSNYWLNSQFLAGLNPADRRAVDLAEQSYKELQSDVISSSVGVAAGWLLVGRLNPAKVAFPGK